MHQGLVEDAVISDLSAPLPAGGEPPWYLNDLARGSALAACLTHLEVEPALPPRLLDTICNLTRLTTLDITLKVYGNLLPECLSKLTSLQDLTVAAQSSLATQVTAECITRLTKMTELSLSNVHLPPGGAAGFPDLQILRLRSQRELPLGGLQGAGLSRLQDLGMSGILIGSVSALSGLSALTCLQVVRSR